MSEGPFLLAFVLHNFCCVPHIWSTCPPTSCEPAAIAALTRPGAMRLLTGAEGEGADDVRPGARAGAAQEVWLLLSSGELGTPADRRPFTRKVCAW